jgi:4-amino-4-deoxy-L-arabinose transferase-like glycosyltransferase
VPFASQGDRKTAPVSVTIIRKREMTVHPAGRRAMKRPAPTMTVMETTIDTRPAPAVAPVAVIRRIFAGKAVWLVAAAAFGVELALSARYGYTRDELYFLSAGTHPALGYVDQPLLTPLLAHLDALLTGNTLAGLRAAPALALAAMVVLTGSIARQLGAGPRGQLLAAVATACCAQYLGAMHELTTTPLDFLFWTILLWLVTRLLTSGNPRWWLAIGGCAGLAMTAKWNIGFLIAGLLLGFACTPAARPLLRSRHLAIAALLFAALAWPDFAWQAAHGWPNLAVFHALQGDAWRNRVQYWPGQVLYTSIVLVPLWAGGIRWALRDTRFRAVGIAAVFVIAAQFVLGGKPYYPGAIYTFCFAAGAAALGPRLAAANLPRRVAGYCLAALISGVISLPLLPAAALARFPVQKINYDLGEEIGWPSQVRLLASVWHSLPAAERVRATLLANNYGEAGAALRYGASFGLPRVYSGANSFWLWGPPPAGDTVAVVIGVDPALLHREFAHVKQVAVYRNGINVDDDEEGSVIYVVSGPRTSWAAAWPAFKDYS